MKTSDPDRRSAEKLAEAIAEGRPIDWSKDAEDIADDKRPAYALLEQVSLAHSRPIGHRANGDAEYPTRWGPLVLEEKIGTGGYSTVYRAYDPLLQRHVALKLMRADTDERDVQRWLKEARRLAQIKHVNVVAVYGAEFFDNCGGIWTELLDGQSVAEIIDTNGPMSAREAATLGIEVCSGLSALHAAGLIHGDIKPNNIFREKGGRIVLLDLGSTLDQTADQPTSGSPPVLAPEIFSQGRPTTAIDIYAIGATLYYATSGDYPVDAHSIEAAKSAQENQEIVPLSQRRPDLPASFVDCVERAINTEPARRFRSAAELQQSLYRFVSGSQPRSRLLAIAALFVVISIAAITWWGSPRIETVSSPLLAATQLEAVNTSGDARHLVDGSSVTVGDQLRMHIRPTRDVQVYILNTDQNGAAFVLFPLPDVSPSNPLLAGQDYMLPGSRENVALDWKVTSRGGQERFIIITSDQPLIELEETISSWAVAGTPQNTVASTQYRGIGGLVENAKAPETNSDLDELLLDLYVTPGVEIESFVLEND